jgi:hypothetical protein
MRKACAPPVGPVNDVSVDLDYVESDTLNADQLLELSAIMNDIDARLKSRLTLDIVSTSRPLRPGHKGSLNKHLILIMHHLGCSMYFFESLLRDQAALVCGMRTSKACLRQWFGTTSSSIYYSWGHSYPGDDGIGDDEEDSAESFFGEDDELDMGVRLSAMADKVLPMLGSGHPMHEPYIQSSLFALQQREAELLDLRIRTRSTAYLMGVPDPCGRLRLNEVYIHLGGSTMLGPVLGNNSNIDKPLFC